MRVARSLVAIMLTCMLSSIVFVSSPTTATADASACTKFVGGLQALLCVNQNERAYGIFSTFIYPDITLDPRFGSRTSNMTRFYTDEVNGQWLELGLRMWTQPGSQPTYRPYWYAHPFGPATWLPESTISDKKVHTFMAIPRCGGCKQWDIFYDFEFAGTTPEMAADRAHYMSTGWSSDFGATIGVTQNRVRFLDGNRNFRLFSTSDTSTLVSPKACNNVKCTWFDSSLSFEGNFVSSWNVAVNSGPAGGLRTAHESLSSTVHEREIIELERRAQQIIDERLAKK